MSRRAALFLALVIGGAGANVQARAEPQPITKNGEVTLTLLSVQGQQAATLLARFSSGDMPLPAAADDSCQVSAISYRSAPAAAGSEPSGEVPSSAPRPLDVLDAGSFIALESPHGVYLSAVRQLNFYRSVSRVPDAPAFLETIGAVPGPLPTLLEVVVPGSAGVRGFPPMRLRLPALEPLVLTAPSDLLTIGPGTTLTWSGSSKRPNAELMISLNLLGSGRGINVRCRARDDGSFSFPNQIRREMSAADLRGSALSGQIVRVVTFSKVKRGARLSVYVVEGQFDLNR